MPLYLEQNESVHKSVTSIKSHLIIISLEQISTSNARGFPCHPAD